MKSVLRNPDWPTSRLDDIAEVVRGSSPRPSGDPRFFNGDYLPWITVGEVTSIDHMYLQQTASKLTRAGAERTRILKPGIVLLTNSGATLGVPKINKLTAGANDGIAAFLNLHDSLLPEYLYFFLQAHTDYFRQKVASGMGQPNLNTDLIGAVHISLPPRHSQEAIIGICKAWDASIYLMSDLVTRKTLFKQGLMQQLLIGRRRFRGFKDKWHSVFLKDVTQECDERNRGRLGSESVMAVTKVDGIVPMRERTIAADIDRYLVVQKNCFAYNPMRINIGSIARWNGSSDVLVSPDYVVFCCKEPIGQRPAIDAEFLDQYRHSGLWKQYVTSSGNGTVRVRIYYSDLGCMKLMLPSLREQRKIATFLTSVDREIDLLRQEMNALNKQKKGLMQRLLTGQVRIKT